MFDDIKDFLLFKSIDICINENNYELALTRLNYLINKGYKTVEAHYKRGCLCRKLLMHEDAYSDLTYVIIHSKNNINALSERLKLNYEMSNYTQAISDADTLMSLIPYNIEVSRLKLMSYIFSKQFDSAKNYCISLNDNNIYLAIRYLFNESAKYISLNEFAKAMTLLELVEFIDPDNPIKLLNEANLFKLTGNIDEYKKIMSKITLSFPKYFISHFKFTDIYKERDYAEICFLLELRIFDKNNTFDYQFHILEGYKNQIEGHIIDSKECFEKAININENKPEAYILLAQTLQLMSGYDSPDYIQQAEKYYEKAKVLYKSENLLAKVSEMESQIKHLKSNSIFKK